MAKSKGDPQVKLAQEWLGLRRHPVTIDGLLGPATRQALKEFQLSNGLPGTGILTPETLERLQAPMARVQQLINIAHTTPTPSFVKLMVMYANRHLAEHPREIGGQNAGPWVRLYMNGKEGPSWPWCAGFVSYLMKQSAETLGVKPPIQGSFSCDVLANRAKAKNLLVLGNQAGSYKPHCNLGGLFLVKGKKAGDWVHVGVITDHLGSTFRTIEGNSDSLGSFEGREVCSRIRAYTNVDVIRFV